MLAFRRLSGLLLLLCLVGPTAAAPVPVDRLDVSFLPDDTDGVLVLNVRQLLGTCGYGGRPARRAVRRVSLFYGVRTAELAAGVEDFRAAGAEVHLASDDGTLGARGYVTALLEQYPPPDHLVGCGPEPMLHALADLARRRGVPCQVSLETPMACGVGVCFSCVARVRTADGWDYRRVCVDGPVFDAACLALE